MSKAITKDPEQWEAQDFFEEASRVLGDKDLVGPDVLVGAAMLAALVVGPNIYKVSRKLGVNHQRLSQAWRNLRIAKVFSGKTVRCNWFAEDGTGGLAFCCDVMVGRGLLVKS